MDRGVDSFFLFSSEVAKLSAPASLSTSVLSLFSAGLPGTHDRTLYCMQSHLGEGPTSEDKCL